MRERSQGCDDPSKRGQDQVNVFLLHFCHWKSPACAGLFVWVLLRRHPVCLESIQNRSPTPVPDMNTTITKMNTAGSITARAQRNSAPAPSSMQSNSVSSRITEPIIEPRCLMCSSEGVLAGVCTTLARMTHVTATAIRAP